MTVTDSTEDDALTVLTNRVVELAHSVRQEKGNSKPNGLFCQSACCCSSSPYVRLRSLRESHLSGQHLVKLSGGNGPGPHNRALAIDQDRSPSTVVFAGLSRSRNNYTAIAPKWRVIPYRGTGFQWYFPHCIPVRASIACKRSSDPIFVRARGSLPLGLRIATTP